MADQITQQSLKLFQDLIRGTGGFVRELQGASIETVEFAEKQRRAGNNYKETIRVLEQYNKQLFESVKSHKDAVKQQKDLSKAFDGSTKAVDQFSLNSIKTLQDAQKHIADALKQSSAAATTTTQQFVKKFNPLTNIIQLKAFSNAQDLLVQSFNDTGGLITSENKHLVKMFLDAGKELGANTPIIKDLTKKFDNLTTTIVSANDIIVNKVKKGEALSAPESQARTDHAIDALMKFQLSTKDYSGDIGQLMDGLSKVSHQLQNMDLTEPLSKNYKLLTDYYTQYDSTLMDLYSAGYDITSNLTDLSHDIQKINFAQAQANAVEALKDSAGLITSHNKTIIDNFVGLGRTLGVTSAEFQDIALRAYISPTQLARNTQLFDTYIKDGKKINDTRAAEIDAARVNMDIVNALNLQIQDQLLQSKNALSDVIQGVNGIDARSVFNNLIEAAKHNNSIFVRAISNFEYGLEDSFNHLAEINRTYPELFKQQLSKVGIAFEKPIKDYEHNLAQLNQLGAAHKNVIDGLLHQQSNILRTEMELNSEGKLADNKKGNSAAIENFLQLADTIGLTNDAIENLREKFKLFEMGQSVQLTDAELQQLVDTQTAMTDALLATKKTLSNHANSLNQVFQNHLRSQRGVLGAFVADLIAVGQNRGVEGTPGVTEALTSLNKGLFKHFLKLPGEIADAVKYAATFAPAEQVERTKGIETPINALAKDLQISAADYMAAVKENYGAFQRFGGGERAVETAVDIKPVLKEAFGNDPKAIMKFMPQLWELNNIFKLTADEVAQYAKDTNALSRVSTIHFDDLIDAHAQLVKNNKVQISLIGLNDKERASRLKSLSALDALATNLKMTGAEFKEFQENLLSFDPKTVDDMTTRMSETMVGLATLAQQTGSQISSKQLEAYSQMSAMGGPTAALAVSTMPEISDMIQKAADQFSTKFNNIIAQGPEHVGEAYALKAQQLVQLQNMGGSNLVELFEKALTGRARAAETGPAKPEEPKQSLEEYRAQLVDQGNQLKDWNQATKSSIDQWADKTHDFITELTRIYEGFKGSEYGGAFGGVVSTLAGAGQLLTNLILLQRTGALAQTGAFTAMSTMFATLPAAITSSIGVGVAALLGYQGGKLLNENIRWGEKNERASDHLANVLFDIFGDNTDLDPNSPTFGTNRDGMKRPVTPGEQSKNKSEIHPPINPENTGYKVKPSPKEGQTETKIEPPIKVELPKTEVPKQETKIEPPIKVELPEHNTAMPETTPGRGKEDANKTSLPTRPETTEQVKTLAKQYEPPVQTNPAEIVPGKKPMPDEILYGNDAVHLLDNILELMKAFIEDNHNTTLTTQQVFDNIMSSTKDSAKTLAAYWDFYQKLHENDLDLPINKDKEANAKPKKD